MSSRKSANAACILAIFLGGLGAHLFYIGKYKRAVLYLIFCWTYIPIFLGWIDLLFIRRWVMEKNHYTEKTLIVPMDPLLKSQEKRLEREVSTEDGKIIKEKLNKLGLFYNEDEVILDKYAHLKTPQHILDQIRSVQHSKKKKLDTGYGITFEFSYSSSSTDFLKDSIKYANEKGKPAVHQPLMAYWTTFDQLDKKQKEWYFYWRNQVLHGNYLNTDLSYLILFTYELINYSFNQNAAFNVSMMIRLLEAYRERTPKVERYLKSWIHDFLIELHEKELAKEWDSTAVSTSSLYDRLLEKSESLGTISITLWKKYINGYRETEFFRGNKNKIYKVFKESIPLLREEFEEQGISYMDRWFQEVKVTQSNYLFGSAVIGRNISQREYFIETAEIRPTQELYEDVTTLFRLAENVTRIVTGEKRQLKVNEEKLPEGLKERMVDMFSKTSASKTRFKKVQDKSSQSEGSKIPQPETEKSPQKVFVLDYERVQQLQQESKELQELFEEIEVGPFEIASGEHEKNGNTSSDILTNENSTNPDVFSILNTQVEENDMGLVEALTAEEIEFLTGFEDGKRNFIEANQWLKNKGIMSGMFITSLNEKSHEFLGDNLVETSSEDYELYEEFEYILAKLKVGEA